MKFNKSLTTESARSTMANALDSDSREWGFKSLRADQREFRKGFEKRL